MARVTTGPLRVFVVAGEASGDELGAPMLRALRAAIAPRPLEIAGVGGPTLQLEGLNSLFPQEDIAVNGVSAVLPRLRLILRRIRETAAAVKLSRPDVLITIDSPDFALRVARSVRRDHPGLPIVHWVCPSVWAWRPGRARRMRPHVDRVLCLLPFEPGELKRLGGPEGVYTGHPLIERRAMLRPASEAERQARGDADSGTILLLPGSRRSEVSRLMRVFGETTALISAKRPELRFVLPAVDHLRLTIEAEAMKWTVPVTVLSGESAKLAAFRSARAALAASGTVTLELALAGVPTVAAYRVAGWEAAIARRLIRVPSVLLPNLVLGERLVPELLQGDATASRLAAELEALIADGPMRERQLAGFDRLDAAMTLADRTPSEAAARAILGLLPE